MDVCCSSTDKSFIALRFRLFRVLENPIMGVSWNYVPE